MGDPRQLASVVILLICLPGLPCVLSDGALRVKLLNATLETNLVQVELLRPVGDDDIEIRPNGKSIVFLEARIVFAHAAIADARNCSVRASINGTFSGSELLREGFANPKTEEQWITSDGPTSLKVAIVLQPPDADDCCFFIVRCSCPSFVSGFRDSVVSEAFVFFSVSDAVNTVAFAADRERSFPAAKASKSCSLCDTLFAVPTVSVDPCYPVLVVYPPPDHAFVLPGEEIRLEYQVNTSETSWVALRIHPYMFYEGSLDFYPEGYVVFNSTKAHVLLHQTDIPAFLGAALRSTVVQFSFLTSQGKAGVPSKPQRGCQVAFLQRFFTLVHHITVYRPQTGRIFDRSSGVNLHIHYGVPRITLDTGASLWAGMVLMDASRQAACTAPSHLELNWDIRTFALQESSLRVAPIPSHLGAEAGQARSEAFRMSPGELADDAARKACSSAFDSSASDDWTQAETALGVRLRKSRLVAQCTKKLHHAIAHFLDCESANEQVDWGTNASSVQLTSVLLNELSLTPDPDALLQCNYGQCGYSEMQMLVRIGKSAEEEGQLFQDGLFRKARFEFLMKSGSEEVLAHEQLELVFSPVVETSHSSHELFPAHHICGAGFYNVRLNFTILPESPERTLTRVYVNGHLLAESDSRRLAVLLFSLRAGTYNVEIRLLDDRLRILQSVAFPNDPEPQRKLLVMPSHFPDADVQEGCVDQWREQSVRSMDEPGAVLMVDASTTLPWEAVDREMSPTSAELVLLRPVDGECLERQLQLELAVPKSVLDHVLSLLDSLHLLITLDQFAVTIPLNLSSARFCVLLDTHVLIESLNSGEKDSFPSEVSERAALGHTLRLALVTSGWMPLAWSSPVVLAAQHAGAHCQMHSSCSSDCPACALAALSERQPDILRSPRRPCTFNRRVDGLWSGDRFVPFDCYIHQFDLSEAQSCLQNRTIVIAGASVMRGFFTGLARTISEHFLVDSNSPHGHVTPQVSSSGKVVKSDWWKRRAEIALCAKSAHGALSNGGRAMNGKCTSGCWSCEEQVGSARIAYLWTDTVSSDSWDAIARELHPTDIIFGGRLQNWKDRADIPERRSFLHAKGIQMKEAEDYFSSLLPKARVFMLEVPTARSEGPGLSDFQQLLGLRQRSPAKPRLELVDVLSMFTSSKLFGGYADDVHPKDFVHHQAAQLLLTGLCGGPKL